MASYFLIVRHLLNSIQPCVYMTDNLGLLTTFSFYCLHTYSTFWKYSYIKESNHGAATASSSPSSAELRSALRLRSIFLLGSQSSFCPEFVVSVRICVCWPLQPWNNRVVLTKSLGSSAKFLNLGTHKFNVSWKFLSRFVLNLLSLSVYVSADWSGLDTIEWCWLNLLDPALNF